jgi:DNA-binding NtrC family response regulator
MRSSILDNSHRTQSLSTNPASGCSARHHREGSPATPRILVVDDDYSFSALLTLYFTAQGYKVLPAHSASEAKWLISQSRFDLMILNRCLNGRNALGLLDLSKARNPDIPVIVFMAADAEPFLEASLAGKADGVFRKLGPLELLSQQVCRHVGAPDLSVGGRSEALVPAF